ncbi:CBU_0592 family membrane protein [Pleionea sediminis]|uniref:CBU_0592 family membrane protein n=1 Tax=Pleionea sediminis TaxID=2569479 RepID=UPI0013DDF207|nr:hypothetical protein [Pleionea sediminis]
MAFEWYDAIGALGSLLIIGAFFFLQIEKIKSDSMSYSILNGLGAVLVLISVFYSFNLAALILQLFWLAISAIGIIRVVKKKKQS